MSIISKILVGLGAVGVVLGTLAFFGLSPYGQTIIQQFAGSSPAGTTFNTAKIAEIAVSPSAPGANATSSSILNTDANDRLILSEEIGCQGVGQSKAAYSGAGLAALTLSVATSSTASPAANANTNVVGSSAATIGTSTPNFVMASSTASNGATSPGSALVSNIWAAGSYLTLTFNATNTASCVVGVRYLAS